METINHTAQGMSIASKDFGTLSSIPTAPRLPLFRNAQSNYVNLRIRNWRTSPPGSLARNNAGYWWEPASFSTRPVVMGLPPLPKWNTLPSRINLRTRDWIFKNKFSQDNFTTFSNLHQQRQLQLARDLYLSRSTFAEPVSYDQIQSSAFGHGIASSIPAPPALPNFNQFRQGHSQLAHPHRARPINSLRTRDWKQWRGSEQQCFALDGRRDQMFKETFFSRQPTVTFADPVVLPQTSTISETVTPMSNTYTTTTVTPAPVSAPVYVAPVQAPLAPVATTSSSSKRFSALGMKLKKSLRSRSSKHTVSEPSVQTTPAAHQTMTTTVVPTTSTYAPAASANVANTNTFVYSAPVAAPAPAVYAIPPANTITATSSATAVAPSTAPASTTTSKRASVMKVKGLIKDKVGHMKHKSAQQPIENRPYGTASN